MSYCRFSSDNWKSDVYVYHDVSGCYVTHVAEKRLVGDVPPLADIEDPDAFIASYLAQREAVDRAKTIKIGGKFDGQSFDDATLEDLYERLLHLQKEGYHVPADALEIISAEMQEGERDGLS